MAFLSPPESCITVWVYLLLACTYCVLQLPNQDLESRRSMQKVDPVTGEIYTKDVYEPEKPKPKKEVQCRHFHGN